MKKISLLFIISIGLLLSNCKEKARISLDEKAIENPTQSEQEKYFGTDTILIRKYKSEAGNEIELRGSRSKDLYSLNIITKSGKKYNYQIADSWYAASHSAIEWDNSDYIFIRQGCGSMCWNGKLLALKGEKKMQDFLFYLYSDRIKNHIAFADSINDKKLIIENIKTKSKTEVELDLCEEAVMPILTIDTIYETINNNLLVKYTKRNCRDKKETLIRLP